MSSFMPVECKCSICEAENTYQSITSTNAFGSPDLDLRPPEMQRSTMPYWIQKCPNCGYVSSEVSDQSCVTTEWLKTDRYLTCEGISFGSKLAEKFYQYYLISLEDGEARNAFFAVQRAAWACDDALDDDNAIICRKLAITQIDKLFQDESLNQDTLRIIKADLLRRSMLFDKLIDEYSSVHFSTDLLNRILAFEIEKAKEHDPGCYRIEHVGTDGLH